MKNHVIRTGIAMLFIFSLCFSSCNKEEKQGWIVESINLFPFQQDGLYGYVNDKGKVVIPFLYEEAGLFRNGRALVKYKNQNISLVKYWTLKSKDTGNKIGAKLYQEYRQYVEIGNEHLEEIVYYVDSTGKHGSIVSKKYFKGGQARCRTWTNGYYDGGNYNWRSPTISDYQSINSVRRKIKLSIFENS